eukprot:TRINITY_DN13383_c0_g1_i1.p1 TRINITY_DN13383_c0_g1~~TRINITY_DN13383_c0_g1_i1.p1  ORF type:complete len:325 (+),score=46.81 TRINITY_DN13383_c0_g1_i1:76-975(+)
MATLTSGERLGSICALRDAEPLLFVAGTAEPMNNSISLFEVQDSISPITRLPRTSKVKRLKLLDSETILSAETAGLHFVRCGEDLVLSGTNAVPNTANLTDIAPTSDGASVVACSESGALISIDVQRNSIRQIGSDPSSLYTLASISPTLTVTGGASGQLHKWDIRSPRPVESWREGSSSAAILCLAAHPASPNMLISGGTEGTLCVWDLRRGQWPVMRSRAHQSDVTDIRYHNNAPDHVLTSGLDALCLLWHISGEAVSAHTVLQAPYELQALDVAASADTVVVCGDYVMQTHKGLLG